jgi:hypothetical protein
MAAHNTILTKECRHHETFTVILNHDYAVILFTTIRTGINIVKIAPSRPESGEPQYLTN